MNLNPFLKDRANKTVQWLPTDSEENYHLPNLYTPDSFNYTFNECGLRCDSFDLTSELPIVFLGCSYTEGIGLPIEEVWSHLLLEKIQKSTGKKIPYWSLALGGKGLDNQVKMLYDFIKTHSVKYIFCLFPASGRRDFCYGAEPEKTWMPNPILHTNPLPHLINDLFSDPYYIRHEDYRSLMLLDSIRIIQQAHVVASSWRHNDINDELFKNFPEIKFFQPTFLSWGDATRRGDKARDNQHPGAKYHESVASVFWNKVKHLF